jgi:metal-responsive CopG/Arc/MetJ family transcriptional regulator
VSRKQVIVQLDDELVRKLDDEAARRRVSRSELIRRAATSFLDAPHEDEQERELIEAYRRLPEDPAETEALHRLAVESWSDW